jgi:hypothetical protein
VYGTRIFGRAVHQLATAAGSTFPAGTTAHDLRHDFASVLLAAGLSVVDVAELLGHEDATMVLRVYGHVIRAARTAPGARSTPPGGRPQRPPPNGPRPRDGPDDLQPRSPADQHRSGAVGRRCLQNR